MRKAIQAIFRGIGIAVGHDHLHLDGATHGVHHAGKFRQRCVAMVFTMRPTITEVSSVQPVPRRMPLSASMPVSSCHETE